MICAAPGCERPALESISINNAKYCEQCGPEVLRTGEGAMRASDREHAWIDSKDHVGYFECTRCGMTSGGRHAPLACDGVRHWDNKYRPDTPGAQPHCRMITADSIPRPDPFDVVAKPKHYNTGEIEVWDFILDQDLPYLAGNVVKYICRFRHKGTPLLDLKKARAYLDKQIAQIESVEAKAV